MLKCTKIRNAGSFALEMHRVTHTVELDADQRHLRRKKVFISPDIDVLVDLPSSVHLAQGDALELEDGQLVVVKAAPQNLMQVEAEGKLSLTQLAWHIGNRHLPAQVEDSRILLEPDHVIEKMLTGLGARVTKVVEPFNPLAGAYHEHSHG